MDHIERFFRRDAERPPAVTAVLDAVAEAFCTTVTSLMGPQRDKHIAMARHVSAYIIRHRFYAGTHQVGRWMGHRDHSTVINSCKRVKRELDHGNPLVTRLVGEMLGEVAAE